MPQEASSAPAAAQPIENSHPKLHRWMENRAVWSGLLVLLVFAVYWPALGNGFVWDDTALVLRDPLIRSWQLIPEGFRHFLFLDATGSDFYRPIQRLTYTFDYALYAFQPWGYHLTNILLQAGAAVALFLFADELLGLRQLRVQIRNHAFVAFVVAGLWAIHPVHSAAVTYVAGRADPLAALFGFLGLFFATTTLRDEEERLSMAVPAAACCFFAAMLSKESALGLLAAWLCVLIVRRHFKRLRKWLGIALILLAAYGTLRLTAIHESPPPPNPAPWSDRPTLIVRALAEYAQLLIAPVDLRMERDVTPPDRFQMLMASAVGFPYKTLAGFILFCALAMWCLVALKTRRLIFLCLMCFVVTYLPVSNILPLNATAAEHWLYVPSAFLLLAIGLVLWPLFGGSEKVKPPRALFAATWAVFLLWCVFLGVRTFLRNMDWKSQKTFLEATIRDGGDSERMYVNLSQVALTDGKPQEAVDYLLEALRRAPDERFARMNLAVAYMRLGDYDHAHVALEKLLDDSFMKAPVLEMLAVLETKEGKGTGFQRMTEAVAAAPGNWAIRQRYLRLLDEMGRTGDAIRDLRNFVDAHGFRAESWLLLANLLLKNNEPEEAERAFRRAAAYDVHDSEARKALLWFKSIRQGRHQDFKA